VGGEWRGVKQWNHQRTGKRLAFSLLGFVGIEIALGLLGDGLEVCGVGGHGLMVWFVVCGLVEVFRARGKVECRGGSFFVW